MTELLVFGEDWGRHPSSTQHLITALKNDYTITWINSIGLRQPTFNFKDLKRLTEKARYLLKRTPQPQSTYYLQQPDLIIHPKVWPLAQTRLLQSLNQTLLSRQIPPKKGKRVVWVSLPSAIDVLPICQADTVIYYCGDDFSSLTGVDHHYVAQCERKLVREADIVFSASHKLQQKFPSNKSYLLPHGVDDQLFNPTHLEPLPSQHTIGFYGSINNWLDTALLKKLAQARPKITFELIGRHDCDTSHLNSTPNIRFLNPIAHSQLPAAMKHWTMAILPFVDNDQIRSCNPLKLREYLAMGLPIISSHYPAAMEYFPHIAIAKNTQDWLHAIDAFCKLDKNQREQHEKKSRQLIKKETWNQRARVIEAQISKILSTS
ncbi:glycosyltransferase [Vibrio sp. Of7-15]|uniref:glycosyltransferase family protein n=1 Tax=Vibrio sp. Of7-15 TaxID=2724879 RepID=UPI001EF3A1C9|nr:glycosyltransferase [Vibrio sp. Of7-15]MCG7499912.1 glycosyltransferase [Vibrio sp. Of7-15]